MKCFCSNVMYKFVEDNKKIYETFKNIDAHLFKCSKCNYFTYDVYPTESDLEWYYSPERYKSSEGGWFTADAQYSEGHWDDVVTSINELIEKNLKDKSIINIHDIGCGFGGLVHKLNENKQNLVTGTDLCSKAIEDGRNEKQNNKIYHENALYFLKNLNVKQDIIILHHCLEHMIDPLSFIIKIKEFITNNGFLFVRVPNSYSIFSKFKSIKYHWYSYPDHLHYFSPSSANLLFTLGGYSTLESGCTTRLSVGLEKADFLMDFFNSQDFDFDFPIKTYKILRDSLIPKAEEYQTDLGKYLASQSLGCELQVIGQNNKFLQPLNIEDVVWKREKF